YRSRTTAMERLTDIVKTQVGPLRSTLKELSADSHPNVFAAATQSLRNLERLQNAIAPLTSAYFAEQAVASARVLFAEDSVKECAVARMALGGTGVELDIVTNLDAGRRLLSERPYDVVCANLALVDLTRFAMELHPGIKTALVTGSPGAEMVATLRLFPHLSNIVARSETDRAFNVKNMLTTVTKLVSGDIFGIEKFLSWGAEVQSRTVVSSTLRHDHEEEVHDYFFKLGASKVLLARISAVTEELLSNAIYDAPHDKSGVHKYNFNRRTTPVTLEPDEYATLRFATDGILAAVSVEDPFGALDRATILDYLGRCYSGEFGHSDVRKGGGGLGTFQMMETADLIVYNVRQKSRTEVIALFALERDARLVKYKSFHYFGV
ncbi:MAG: hypothetical protein NTV34_00205, partial [Proteobacteria bacterium]|nr:hypothetical protein [Pseudomonadota bacterium]